jgi:methyl-accepting chemotaxis protein
MTLVSIVGFAIILFISTNTLRQDLLHEKKQRLSAVIDSAIAQIKYLDKSLPREKAQQQARALLNHIRYDGNNYLFVIDKSRKVIVHPLKPKLVGKQMGVSRKDPATKHWFTFVDIADHKGGGTLIYNFTTPSGQTLEKMSYLNHYHPWGWVIGSGILLQDIDHELNRQYTKLTLITLLIVAVMVILGYFISRTIIHPLRQIGQAMREVVRGDLTTEINITGRDEFSLVGQGINESISAVRTALKKSVVSAQQLSEAANRIAASAEETKFSANSQRDQLTQVATAMNEMNSTVTEVANHAESTAKDSQEASRETALGEQNVATTVSQIHQLSQSLTSVGEQVDKLKDGVMEIGEVTTVISNISEQTNLLALNAAIEAARAGEQGRGFAVVADEVRELASRTNRSTLEIQTMISQLQELAIDAADTMDKSRDMAGNSVKSAEHCGEDLKLIVSHIQHISDKTIQIATAAEEQNVVTEEINRNISAISDAATGMSDSATHLAQEGEHLKALSAQLDETLVQFKL